MPADDVFVLLAGALLLGLIAVLIDRLNFPQRRFVPKRTALVKGTRHRDRTGAHITDFDPADPEG
ncbi:MAG: hypothetical protein O3C27_15650 [Actinomycetota bacterium]|nr:hypothetical protein [Actinomycetota bacterium]